jgi:hypothetical protein
VNSWKGPIRKKQFRLPLDLHQAMKAKASMEGITVEQAYIAAATAWLGRKTPDDLVGRVAEIERVLGIRRKAK